MEIDVNEVYRRVTTQIFSTLDITKAMERTLEVLKEIMPADHMDFVFVNPDDRTARSIARAGKAIGKKPPEIIPLSDGMINMFNEMISSKQPFYKIMNNPEENPLLIHGVDLDPPYLEYFAVEFSAIALFLVIDGINVGHFSVAAKGYNRYKQEHADLLVKLHEPFSIAAANALAHRRVLRLQAMIEDDNKYLRQEMFKLTGDRIIGEDFGLREVMTHVGQVAPGTSPVLLYGETGVGKDLVATAIHLASPRSENPMIRVNCGAIPDNLIDSELFGHEKGAFTGAIKQKRGRFERAHTGTIFLDEVGELPPQAQVRLLRVLQNGEFERVGGSETIQVDARVITATNRNLESMVRQGTFREDLYFRLNVFPIVIPPLRQRISDIPALIHHFVQKKSMQLKLTKTATLSPGSMDALLRHDWPGNVRELENLVERSMILYQDGVLRFDQLLTPGITKTSKEKFNNGDVMGLEEAIAAHIRNALEAADGKIHGPGGAAALLKINPSTLRSKMKKLGIIYNK